MTFANNAFTLPMENRHAPPGAIDSDNRPSSGLSDFAAAARLPGERAGENAKYTRGGVRAEKSGLTPRGARRAPIGRAA